MILSPNSETTSKFIIFGWTIIDLYLFLFSTKNDASFLPRKVTLRAIESIYAEKSQFEQMQTIHLSQQLQQFYYRNLKTRDKSWHLKRTLEGEVCLQEVGNSSSRDCRKHAGSTMQNRNLCLQYNTHQQANIYYSSRQRLFLFYLPRRNTLLC